MTRRAFFPSDRVKSRRKNAAVRGRLAEPIERVATDALRLHLAGDEATNAIVLQEARGQVAVVECDVLPARGIGGAAADVLRSWGFEIGDPVADDPMFCHVRLPRGWRKVASDHPMWSHVVDDRGRERIAVFFKAAFYDRRADCTVTPRYGVEWVPSTTSEESRSVRVVDRATGAVLVEMEDVGYRLGATGYVRPEEEWIAARYPRWREVGAYWDD